MEGDAEYEVMRDRNIGPLIHIDYLINTYQDYSLTEGLFDLREAYPSYRPVLGEGNCFYRAVAFSYLRQVDLSSFDNVFQPIDNYCQNSGIYLNGRELVNLLLPIYKSNLAPIMHLQGAARQAKLTQFFNDIQNFDKLMIMYMRSVNYHEINDNYQKYQPYLDTDKPDQIQKIKKFGEEAEGLQFDAMANALNVEIVTNSVTAQGFNDYHYKGLSPTVRIDLFFRPGHYDIIYQKNSIYLKGIGSKMKEITTPMYPSPTKNTEYQPSFNQKYPSRPNSRPQNTNNNLGNQYQYTKREQHRLQKRSNDPPRNSKSLFQNQNQNQNQKSQSQSKFHRENDQKDARKDLYQKEKNSFSGLDTKASSQFQDQKIKAKKVLSDDPWETPEIKVGEKNKVQQMAVICLFLTIVGYLILKL